MTCHSAQDQLQGASLRHPYSQGSFFFATVQSATEMSASHVPEPESQRRSLLVLQYT